MTTQSQTLNDIVQNYKKIKPDRQIIDVEHLYGIITAAAKRILDEDSNFIDIRNSKYVDILAYICFSCETFLEQWDLVAVQKSAAQFSFEKEEELQTYKTLLRELLDFEEKMKNVSRQLGGAERLAETYTKFIQKVESVING